MTLDDLIDAAIPKEFGKARLKHVIPAVADRVREHQDSDLWLFGPRGHGKSYCAAAMLMKKIRNHASAYWWPWIRPEHQYGSEWVGPKVEETRPGTPTVSLFRQVEWLVVDAVTEAPIVGGVLDRGLIDVIAFRRARGRRTIVTSVEPPPEWLGFKTIDVTGRCWVPDVEAELTKRIRRSRVRQTFTPAGSCLCVCGVRHPVASVGDGCGKFVPVLER